MTSLSNLSAESLVFLDALDATTKNWSTLRWRGYRIQQNILDLWEIQEALTLVNPALLIETGTKYGGSAVFYADVFRLLGSNGRVRTIDKAPQCSFTDPRIDFVTGHSTDPDIVREAAEKARDADGPVVVILDSGHSEAHVFQEMTLYGPMVKEGSFMLVQDGVIDLMPRFAGVRPGPLRAIMEFQKTHPEFVYETRNKFLLTYHPGGWLWRKLA